MDFVFTILLAFVVVITMYTIILVKNKLAMKDIDCKKNMIGKKNGTLIANSLDVPLNECYVMTAYNCCSVKEDWVDLCALSHCIKLGCRCLDFEIFEHNNKPVVGTTSMKNGIRRDSYNYIKLSKVISKIMEEAFSMDYELHKDPLIVNLRIKVTTIEFYDKVAYDISNGTHIQYKNSKIEGSESMTDLSGIIYMSSDIHEETYNGSIIGNYLNLIGEKASTNLSNDYCGSGNIETNDVFNVFQVNNTNLMDNENSVNKLRLKTDILKISIPDDIKINPNYCYHKKAKINFIGMSFREKIPKDYSLIPWVDLKSEYKEDLLDFEELGNLNNYIKWFYDNGSAFIHMYSDKHTVDADQDEDEREYNSCESSTNLYAINQPTIVNKRDNTKTKIRKYWYNNIMSKLI